VYSRIPSVVSGQYHYGECLSGWLFLSAAASLILLKDFKATLLGLTAAVQVKTGNDVVISDVSVTRQPVKRLHDFTTRKLAPVVVMLPATAATASVIVIKLIMSIMNLNERCCY